MTAQTPANLAGYVFLDFSGCAWGPGASGSSLPGRLAARPFRTDPEAYWASKRCIPMVPEIVAWTPECGVPPMPEEVS